MVFDIILYYSIATIPTLLLYKTRYNYIEGFQYRLSVVLACVIPSIFFGIRHGVGTDWYTYYDFYNYTSIYASWWLLVMEPGFCLLASICKEVGLSFYGFSFVCCCLLEISIIKSLEQFKLQKWQWLGYFVASFTIYFVAYNITRQMLAVSFLILAYSYYRNQKKWKALLMFVSAISFHKTAIIGIFLLLILQLYNRLHLFGKKEVVIVSFLLSLLSVCILVPAVSAIQNYYDYYNSTEYILQSFNVSELSFLAYYVPEWILIFIFMKRKCDKRLLECYAIFMSAGIFQFIGCFYPFSDRLSWYFIGFRLLMYPMIISELVGKSRKQFYALSVAFFLIYFFILFYVLGGDGLFPYVVY